MEDAYDEDCWLYVDMPQIKHWMRRTGSYAKIWLECRGHLSEFQGAGKSSKAGRFSAGDQFLHLYDMGDTTETLITVTGTTWRKPQRETVLLLARNVSPQFRCAKCGTSAGFIYAECVWDTENPFYCESCAQTHGHEDMLLPMTDSPRMSACDRCGERDAFAWTRERCDDSLSSYSRVSASADSDVDLKIKKGQLHSLFQLSGFRLTVEDALHLPVDMVTSEASDCGLFSFAYEKALKSRG